MPSNSPCRAKNPNQCRIHGQISVENLRQQLENSMSPASAKLRAAVHMYAPAYETNDGLSKRLSQFETRLLKAAEDLHELAVQARQNRQALAVDRIRGEISHNISPVIGWLHSELSEQVGDKIYATSPIRHAVDELYERMLTSKYAIADLVNKPVSQKKV